MAAASRSASTPAPPASEMTTRSRNEPSECLNSSRRARPGAGSRRRGEEEQHPEQDPEQGGVHERDREAQQGPQQREQRRHGQAVQAEHDLAARCCSTEPPVMRRSASSGAKFSPRSRAMRAAVTPTVRPSRSDIPSDWSGGERGQGVAPVQPVDRGLEGRRRGNSSRNDSRPAPPVSAPRRIGTITPARPRSAGTADPRWAGRPASHTKAVPKSRPTIPSTNCPNASRRAPGSRG